MLYDARCTPCLDPPYVTVAVILVTTEVAGIAVKARPKFGGLGAKGLRRNTTINNPAVHIFSSRRALLMLRIFVLSMLSCQATNVTNTGPHCSTFYVYYSDTTHTHVVPTPTKSGGASMVYILFLLLFIPRFNFGSFSYECIPNIGYTLEYYTLRVFPAVVYI